MYSLLMEGLKNEKCTCNNTKFTIWYSDFNGKIILCCTKCGKEYIDKDEIEDMPDAED